MYICVVKYLLNSTCYVHQRHVTYQHSNIYLISCLAVNVTLTHDGWYLNIYQLKVINNSLKKNRGDDTDKDGV